jgi:hypothetical protein
LVPGVVLQARDTPHQLQLKRQRAEQELTLRPRAIRITAIHDTLPTGCASTPVRCGTPTIRNSRPNNLQSQFGKAGAYGGSRQGVAEAELQRGLLDRMAGITGTGYQQAYEQAQNQFNEEARRQMEAQELTNRYGFDVLREQQAGGATQRGIEGEGIAADYAQFTEERDFPYKQVQYQQSLLEGLPIGQTSRDYVDPSSSSEALGILGLLSELYNEYKKK